MFKLFRKIHLYFAFPFGLIITLICFTGAMMVFEPEITRIIHSDVYFVQRAGHNPIPLDVLIKRVDATLPDSVMVTGVKIYSDPLRTYQVNISKPRRAAIYIDQYTGKITGRNEPIGFFSTMFKLHRWLLDVPKHGDGGIKVGKLLVGISTIFFILSLLSGIVIWWPRARANLKKSLTIKCSGLYLFWDGLHVAGGIWIVLMILAMGLTGLTWSFDWYKEGFYNVLGAGTESVKKETTERKGIECNYLENPDIDQVYRTLRSAYPKASSIDLNSDSASVTLSEYGIGKPSELFNYTSKDGNLSLTPNRENTSRQSKIRSWIYAIHTGSFGGIFTRIIWFIAAIIGSSLPVTGYYIWIKRIKRHK